MSCKHVFTAELYVVICPIRVLRLPLGHIHPHPTQRWDHDDDDQCEHLIYQANGPENKLRLDICTTNPRDANRHQEADFASGIDTAGDLEDIKVELEEQPM